MHWWQWQTEDTFSVLLTEGKEGSSPIPYFRVLIFASQIFLTKIRLLNCCLTAVSAASGD